MSRGIKRYVLIGAIVGLGISLATLLLAKLNSGPNSNECLRAVVHFLASVPVALFNIPQTVLNILFFVYWILVGGAIGWFLGHKGIFAKLLAFVLLAGIIISHLMVKVKIEQDLEAVADAVGQLIKGWIAQ
ncbi:MAG: hypothetical protein QGI05_01580 [Candidatus Omnitrophota bacterium]|jgi:hypothetical protein|nr:hypothetical protein [Candidatus Omnitrophota bacterium]